MSVDQKCDDFLADTFESFPRLVPLFKALERRFPNKKFPPKHTRKEFQMIDLLLDTIGGGAGSISLMFSMTLSSSEPQRNPRGEHFSDVLNDPVLLGTPEVSDASGC